MKAFDSPFPNTTCDVGGVTISVQDIGTLGVCLLTVLALWAFFRFTTLGLAMRAVAVNPAASRLLGVRVGWMLALGWGLAAVLGAVAGMMAAPTVFLDPSDDADRPHLRVRGGGARRDRQPGRRGRRRAARSA